MNMELRIQAKGITKQYGATSLYPSDGSGDRFESSSLFIKIEIFK